MRRAVILVLLLVVNAEAVSTKYLSRQHERPKREVRLMERECPRECSCSFSERRFKIKNPDNNPIYRSSGFMVMSSSLEPNAPVSVEFRLETPGLHAPTWCRCYVGYQACRVLVKMRDAGKRLR